MHYGPHGIIIKQPGNPFTPFGLIAWILILWKRIGGLPFGKPASPLVLAEMASRQGGPSANRLQPSARRQCYLTTKSGREVPPLPATPTTPTAWSTSRRPPRRHPSRRPPRAAMGAQGWAKSECGGQTCMGSDQTLIGKRGLPPSHRVFFL